jgi:type II secretory pathway predicted ATPase ExeA
MSAYLKFFELEQSPFEGKAQAQVVLGTKALRDAFALIRGGLDEGDARICVSGGPGLGKTSLARALPKLLGDTARVAVVLDPEVSWESLRGSIAKQWGLETGGLARAALIEAAQDRRLVLVIDQAERASEKFLDHLDIILSYRSENDEPVVQSILLARLSGGDQQEPAPIVWWLDRIHTLQLEFAPLPRDGIESYVHKHMKRAGWQGERLFTPEAALAIHGYTGGIPGEVSKLCERLLMEAGKLGLHDIDDAFIHSLCDESEADDESSEDEFEEIVLGEEFDGAEETTHSELPPIELKDVVSDPTSPPASAETLELSEANDEEEDVEGAKEEIDEAERNGSGAWAQADDSLDFQDDPLSAPASPEELRAIFGSVLGRHGQAFAAAAIAAVIGGLGFAWLSGDADPSEPTAVHHSEIAEPGRADATASGPGSTANPEAPPAVLARLRGPVTTTPDTPIAPNPKTAPIEREVLEISNEDKAFEEDFDEEIPEDNLVDTRPAAMFPAPAAPESSSKDRFW